MTDLFVPVYPSVVYDLPAEIYHRTWPCLSTSGEKKILFPVLAGILERIRVGRHRDRRRDREGRRGSRTKNCGNIGR